MDILCLACAGSGKSRTLAYRIAYLVASGSSPESIVAFTFTEKAAESLKRRVTEALAKFGLPQTLVGAMYIGTIHSYSQSIVSGSIDLLLKQDDQGNIIDSHVIDFKSLDNPDNHAPNDWIDLSLQVQLYAYAANEVLGENARIGSVHLLKETGPEARVSIPVYQAAISSALGNISWAVDRILESDYPMRPCRGKCDNCDVKRICKHVPERFSSDIIPPPIYVPSEQGQAQIRAFSEFEE